jgi:anti-sigma B factor antagonist
MGPCRSNPENVKMPEASSRLMIQYDAERAVTIIEFLDRNILDEGNIQQIGDEIGQIIERSAAPKLLINFDHVEHLSSAALGTLITINNKVRQKDGQLRLANIQDQIYEVFVITKLNKLFQIHQTTDEALKNFK